MAKFIKEVKDLEKEIQVKDANGEDVMRKIYQITETQEIVTHVNYESLLRRKTTLEAELARINILLNQVKP